MILTNNAELAAYRGALAEPPIFVPTMGALHAGHASLVRQASRLGGGGVGGVGVIVSVFVNPTQFNEKSDFDRYPRTLLVDARLCLEAGATAVYAPSVEDIYPPGVPEPATPLPPAATEPGLEDRCRPGHFAGVVRVVRRLFELVRPGRAIFGEKDWQQLQVIRQMTRSLGMPIEIVPGPTVREATGLAMSSRNVFLSESDRRADGAALALRRAILAAGRIADTDAAERAMNAQLAMDGITPEYAVIRDGATLGRVIPGQPARALIAARVGAVRLIDNDVWPTDACKSA